MAPDTDHYDLEVLLNYYVLQEKLLQQAGSSWDLQTVQTVNNLCSHWPPLLLAKDANDKIKEFAWTLHREIKHC